MPVPPFVFHGTSAATRVIASVPVAPAHSSASSPAVFEVFINEPIPATSSYDQAVSRTVRVMASTDPSRASTTPANVPALCTRTRCPTWKITASQTRNPAGSSNLAGSVLHDDHKARLLAPIDRILGAGQQLAGSGDSVELRTSVGGLDCYTVGFYRTAGDAEPFCEGTIKVMKRISVEYRKMTIPNTRLRRWRECSLDNFPGSNATSTLSSADRNLLQRATDYLRNDYGIVLDIASTATMDHIAPSTVSVTNPERLRNVAHPHSAGSAGTDPEINQLAIVALDGFSDRQCFGQSARASVLVACNSIASEVGGDTQQSVVALESLLHEIGHCLRLTPRASPPGMVVQVGGRQVTQWSTPGFHCREPGCLMNETRVHNTASILNRQLSQNPDAARTDMSNAFVAQQNTSVGGYCGQSIGTPASAPSQCSLCLRTDVLGRILDVRR